LRVEFRESFLRDIQKLKDRSLLPRIREAIADAEAAATIQSIPGLKRLKGGSNYFRLRIGDYRIGIVQEPKALVFVRVMHRREIYRYFPG
jgi:mRNA interferase RelE/StbE